MIIAFYGYMGQGKTYNLAEYCLNELNNGRVVYTNFAMNWNGYDERNNKWLVLLHKLRLHKLKRYPKTNLRRFHNVAQLQELKDGLVALDEGWLYFDSYVLTKMDIEQRRKIYMSRKDGLDIIYTTQRPSQVHIVLRGLTSVWWECKKYEFRFFAYTKNLFVRILRDVNDYEGKVDHETELDRKVLRPRKEVYDSFDTYEKIELAGDTTPLPYMTKDWPTVEYVEPEISRINSPRFSGIKRGLWNYPIDGVRRSTPKLDRVERIIKV